MIGMTCLKQCEKECVARSVCDGCVTHVPGSHEHRDDIRLSQLGVSGFHHLQQLTEGFSLLIGKRWNALGRCSFKKKNIVLNMQE